MVLVKIYNTDGCKLFSIWFSFSVFIKKPSHPVVKLELKTRHSQTVCLSW